MTAWVAARRQVQRTADELEALQLRLQDILSNLPETTETGSLEDLETTDPETEMRSVIGCVLADCIRPAIRDLRDMLAETSGATLLGDKQP
jgi:hypothetical protein